MALAPGGAVRRRARRRRPRRRCGLRAPASGRARAARGAADVALGPGVDAHRARRRRARRDRARSGRRARCSGRSASSPPAASATPPPAAPGRAPLHPARARDPAPRRRRADERRDRRARCSSRRGRSSTTCSGSTRSSARPTARPPSTPRGGSACSPTTASSDASTAHRAVRGCACWWPTRATSAAPELLLALHGRPWVEACAARGRRRRARRGASCGRTSRSWSVTRSSAARFGRACDAAGARRRGRR